MKYELKVDTFKYKGYKIVIKEKGDCNDSSEGEYSYEVYEKGQKAPIITSYTVLYPTPLKCGVACIKHIDELEAKSPLLINTYAVWGDEDVEDLGRDGYIHTRSIARYKFDNEQERKAFIRGVREAETEHRVGSRATLLKNDDIKILGAKLYKK